MGHGITIDEAVATGDPISATNTNTATGTSTPDTTASSTGEPFLVHCVANESAATGTPPTSYTETRDGDYVHTNYRIPATTGSHTATGGTLSVSTLQLVALLVVEPASGAATQTVVCEVITASSTLFNPKIIQIIKSPVLDVPSTLFSPAVGQHIKVPVISAPSTLFDPEVEYIISAPVLEIPSTVFSPTVIQMLQIVEMQLLQVLSTVLSPAIVGSGGSHMSSIMDRARTNMLVELVLTEPQLDSNTDLMRRVIVDPGQTTITVSSMSAANHLWQYLKTVRDS